MSKANTTLRIEPEVKKEVVVLFKKLGLDLSTATGMFYRQALICQGLPFSVTLHEPNATTYKAMESSEKGEDVYGPFNSVEEMMESLNA